jgi:hypothetical protein
VADADVVKVKKVSAVPLSSGDRLKRPKTRCTSDAR